MTIEELTEIIKLNAEAAEQGHAGARMAIINAEEEIENITQLEWWAMVNRQADLER